MSFLSFLVLHHILSAFLSDEVERLSSKDELSGASFVDIVLEEAVQVVALELDVDPAGRCTSASVFPSLQRLNALCFYFIFGDLALAEVAALVNGLIARKGSVHELTPVVVVRNIPFSMFKFALAACAPPAFPLLVSRFLLEFEGGLDGALLEVEGEESRFIGIVFPF